MKWQQVKYWGFVLVTLTYSVLAGLSYFQVLIYWFVVVSSLSVNSEDFLRSPQSQALAGMIS